MFGISACQLLSPYRHHFERKVARLASHDRNHRVDRGCAALAGFGWVECGLDDRPRAIAGRSDPLRGLGPFRCLLLVAEKIVDMRNADPGTDVLITDVIEALPHEFEQTHLDLVGRSEVGMPAFRTVRTVFSAFPGQKRLAQPCA